MASPPGAVKRKQDVVYAKLVLVREVSRSKLAHLTDVSPRQISCGRSKNNI
jgi:hypothetical protein